MKTLKLGGLALLIALVVGVSAPTVDAQNCNLDPGGCGVIPCSGGCGVSFAILHSNVGYGASLGRFDLVGTEFEATCNGNVGTSIPGCTQLMPPVRFWAYDNYGTANSGCFDGLAGQWMASGPMDFQLAQPNGKWYLYQTNWGGPPMSLTTIDGCVSAVAPLPETVVELSWTDAQSGNTTTDHDSWYLVAAVSNPYDFDKVTGGDQSVPPGGGAAEILPQRVPDIMAVTSSNGAATCPRGTALQGDANADANYIDVQVTALSNVMPDYFTEAGRNSGSQLIAGVQIMMLIGPEPTTSDQSAGWVPARDPAAPTTNVAGIWPWNAAGPVTVSIGPISMGETAWLAGRIVYQDASLNGQVGAGPDASAPQVVSLTGMHCGPFTAGGMPPAVTFDRVEATRTGEGIEVSWTTLYEDDVFGYKIFRAENPGMEAAVEAVSWIDSSGLSTGGSYLATDFAVAGATETTFYYYVQEVTSNGLGDKSPIVEVQGFGFEDDPTGGRNRTSSRR